LQCICFPLEQTVAFLGPFQPCLHYRLGPSRIKIVIQTHYNEIQFSLIMNFTISTRPNWSNTERHRQVRPFVSIIYK
jgi:hypothetical protein